MHEAPSPKPAFKRFRRVTTPPPDKRVVERQMAATAQAFRVLGGSDAARAFLNAHHEGLAGRPVDVAGATEAGYSAVLDILNASVADRISRGE